MLGNRLGPIVLLGTLLGWSPVDAGPSACDEAVTRALRLLPRRPDKIAVVERDEASHVGDGTVHVEAFVNHGGRVVYLIRQGVTLLQATQNGPGIFDYALATVIWHEMAHIDGADEAAAQAAEEQLWMEFIVAERVQSAQGMRYLALLKQRRAPDSGGVGPSRAGPGDEGRGSRGKRPPVCDIVTSPGPDGVADKDALAAAVALLPKTPLRIAVVDVRDNRPALRDYLLKLDAFTVEDNLVVYVVQQSELLKGARVGSVLHRAMLATVLWHEMAHLAGADERGARQAEEKLWMQFVRDGLTDQLIGLRYLQALRRRPDDQLMAAR